MEDKKMTIWGIGPVLIALCAIVTIIGICISHKKFLAVGRIPQIKIIMIVLGILLIALGVFIYFLTVVKSKMVENITETHLITSGVYAWTRNPLYAAWGMVFTGIILIQNNLFLVVVLAVIWLLMTTLIPKEEKILEKIFGEEYLQYKRRVNRCIPWFPKHID